MKRNVGLADQVLRIVAGIILGVLFLFRPMESPWNYILPILSALLIITGVFGRCPIYKVFGFSTWQFHPADKDLKKG